MRAVSLLESRRTWSQVQGAESRSRWAAGGQKNVVSGQGGGGMAMFGRGFGKVGIGRRLHVPLSSICPGPPRPEVGAMGCDDQIRAGADACACCSERTRRRVATKTVSRPRQSCGLRAHHCGPDAHWPAAEDVRRGRCGIRKSNPDLGSWLFWLQCERFVGDEVELSVSLRAPQGEIDFAVCRSPGPSLRIVRRDSCL